MYLFWESFLRAGLMDLADKFTFNGHGLVPFENYVLISYKEPYPGIGSVVLGTNTADKNGNILIKGGATTLVCNDYNGYTTGDYRSGTGSKIWLVPASDFNDGMFTTWNFANYLFETKLINVGCTP
jgi:hypothetical protein